MDVKRRNLLGAAATLPLTGALAWALPTTDGSAQCRELPSQMREFGPLRFAWNDGVNLDAGRSHPISLGALQAVNDYLANRAGLAGKGAYRFPGNRPIEKFARLTNVEPDELAYVQSTTTGEQMALRALGIPASGGHIITDTLHFFGSLPMYRELERQGMAVTFIRDREGRIDPDDIKAAIRPDTRLIALSLVSTVNGFTHDLEHVCNIAHQHGVRVYADIIHAAGCMPLDLRASGVDFAASASYKWLMGEFGLGFVYARRDTHDLLQRSNYGYYGLTRFSSHIYPYDEPGDEVVEYAYGEDANGHFALGTRQQAVIAQLDYSLGRLLEIGVENIQRHAQGLVQLLREELSAMGFRIHTPAESRAPIITCIYENAREKLASIFAEEGLTVTVSRHSFRPTVSVYNTSEDVEHLLRVLRDRVVGKAAT